MIQIFLLPDSPDSAHCAYSDSVSRAPKIIIAFIPLGKEVWKHYCSVILCFFGSLTDCQNGYTAGLWFSVPYL